MFEFATAGRIMFGAGSVRQIGSLAHGLGRRCLLVTGSSLNRSLAVLEALHAQGLETITFQVTQEPSVETVTRGTAQARAAGCDLVIGLGGGSVLDSGKAIAGLLSNPGDPLDYLEVVGGGKTLVHPARPYIAVPTTAGTGSEVTRNAVLGSAAQRVKVSMRSPLLLPRIALVDPELTLGVPPAVTASTGLDALTQLIEPYVSLRANPLSDAFVAAALPRGARALPRAYADGSDLAARTDMAFASLCGGLALANAGLGAAHGFAGPVGGLFDAAHGALCAAFIPAVMQVNLDALRARAPESPALVRYDEVARMLTGNSKAVAADGIRWMSDLCRTLHVPPLSAYGITRADFATIIPKAAAASSMKANPIALTEAELLDILARAV